MNAPARPFQVSYRISVQAGYRGSYDQFVEDKYRKYAATTSAAQICPLSDNPHPLTKEEWLAYFI